VQQFAGELLRRGEGGARTVLGGRAVKLYTHLNFGGNCEETFSVCAKLPGERITAMMTVGDLPADVPAPPSSPTP